MSINHEMIFLLLSSSALKMFFFEHKRNEKNCQCLHKNPLINIKLFLFALNLFLNDFHEFLMTRCNYWISIKKIVIQNENFSHLIGIFFISYLFFSSYLTPNKEHLSRHINMILCLHSKMNKKKLVRGNNCGNPFIHSLTFRLAFFLLKNFLRSSLYTLNCHSIFLRFIYSAAAC